MALPEDHLAKFHKMTDAKEMWEAIKSRFNGNDESTKMQKYILKQLFEGFSVSNSKGPHKGYDRFQSLLSQLEIHGADVSIEDVNQKFLRSLPSAWSQVSLIMRTKPGVDSLSLNDLCLRLDHEDLEQLDEFDLEEKDLKWQVAMISIRMKKSNGNQDSRRRDAWNTENKDKYNGRRSGKHEESKALVTLDGERVDWTSHSEYEQENYALMAYSSSGSDTEVELNKQKGKGNVQKENKPVWNNVQRVNQKNQFVPTAILTRTGKIPVNTARASGTNNVSTARHNFNSHAVLTNAARKINTVKPIVNDVRPKTVFHKTHSPFRRTFNRTTTSRTNFSNQKVNTAEDYPQRALQNKGIVDSGCSRHMTGNKAYLAEYQDFNGGPVAFGGSKCYITGKGKIKTGKLDFEDVCFVKELQHFNLFSVSQMCDKKNKVLFTDSECLVLSPEFKLPDENQVLLRIPRQNNMYSFNLENIVPSGGLACLIAKATIDESNKWHKRLGHVNFKNLNKLVKGNLVRGLPSKIFQNDHTCVACQKGKQHKASCKAKSVSSISQPLQLLHMDLFGPTSVRSLNHKTYCLVITDDFSRFSWVFFLRTKDETSGILKDFIRQIDNQLNQKIKSIRCDNGTEFKNKDFIEFCGSKRIKREYSNARTPQQNGVAERKNRTLIEAARTMLADSFLPNTFWAEAVSTACYVLNRVLVTKPKNKTPYELITGNSEIEAESVQDYFVMPIWSSYTSTVKSLKAKNAGEEPNKNHDLKTDEKTVDNEDQVFFDKLDDDAIDYMETEDAQDVGRTRYVVHEEKESAEKEVSTEDALNIAQPKVSTDKEEVNTDRPEEGTDKQKVSTDKEEVSTDRPDEGTVNQNEGRSATQTAPTTTTPIIFGDDETIAQVLIIMSQNKEKHKEKEKGVELKDVEETERPRPTSTRSLLTLKPLPQD
ncbi:putative ribonuclease H-like domain-containing protein [Tanacetum coccineum]|uniref:Ribonuclease H-like domain-containing protein n=1 Tax=Tanacetum coccineum TaxID=301880 RepID=A0ABQ5HL91_9ASTR